MKLKSGDKVVITEGKHVGKQAIIHDINPTHICCHVEHSFYLWYYPKSLTKLHKPKLNPQANMQQLSLFEIPSDDPWDKYPQQWTSNGKPCKYDGHFLEWGDIRFKCVKGMREYTNPLWLVNWIEDTWSDIVTIRSILHKPMEKSAIAIAANLKPRQVALALEVACNLELIIKKGKAYVSATTK